MTRDILDLIDGAIDDWETSPDAMRSVPAQDRDERLRLTVPHFDPVPVTLAFERMREAAERMAAGFAAVRLAPRSLPGPLAHAICDANGTIHVSHLPPRPTPFTGLRGITWHDQQPEPVEETPAARALRLRRERTGHTGPTGPAFHHRGR